MKKIFKSLIFLIILVLSFQYYENYIFKRYDVLVDYAYYKIPKDSIDLLFVGSSHSYCSFNPRLFDHYLKCNSLNLGTNSQSFTITYFAILEILKRQNPKVIVIEVYPIVNNEKHIVALRPHIDTMKFSINKLRLINNYLSINELGNHFMNTIYYHSRWKDFKSLRKEKYKGYEGWENVVKNKGFGGYVRDFIKNILRYDIYNHNYNSSFSINENYLILLEDLFKLCQKNGIKVILTSPPITRDYANTLGVLHNLSIIDLMNKYDIDSVDFNDGSKKYEKICFLDNDHISLAGADEVSFEMAEYLKENYPVLLNTKNYEEEDRSPEYYFYSGNIENDNNFKTFNLDLKLDEELIINSLKIYKKSDDTFDLFLEIDEDKSTDKVYEISLNEKESSTDISLDKIQLNFKVIKDDVQMFPKFYIRKIKDKKYIYKKEVNIPKNSRYYF